MTEDGDGDGDGDGENCLRFAEIYVKLSASSRQAISVQIASSVIIQWQHL